jgi:hypothetical protein
MSETQQKKTYPEFRVVMVELDKVWEQLVYYGASWTSRDAALKLVSAISELWDIQLVPLYADYDGLVEIYDDEFKQLLIEKGKRVVRKNHVVHNVETYIIEREDEQYAKAKGYAGLLVIHLDAGATIVAMISLVTP